MGASCSERRGSCTVNRFAWDKGNPLSNRFRRASGGTRGAMRDSTAGPLRPSRRQQLRRPHCSGKRRRAGLPDGTGMQDDPAKNGKKASPLRIGSGLRDTFPECADSGAPRAVIAIRGTFPTSGRRGYFQYWNDQTAPLDRIRNRPPVAGARTAHQAKKTAGGRSSSFRRRLRTNRLPCVVCWVRFPAWASPRKEVAPMWQFLTDVAAQIVAGVVVALLRRLMK